MSSFFGLSKDAPAIGDAEESDSDSEEAQGVQLWQLVPAVGTTMVTAVIVLHYKFGDWQIVVFWCEGLTFM